MDLSLEIDDPCSAVFVRKFLDKLSLTVACNLELLQRARKETGFRDGEPVDFRTRAGGERKFVTLRARCICIIRDAGSRLHIY